MNTSRPRRHAIGLTLLTLAALTGCGTAATPPGVVVEVAVPGRTAEDIDAGPALRLGQQLLATRGVMEVRIASHDGKFTLYVICDGRVDPSRFATDIRKRLPALLPPDVKLTSVAELARGTTLPTAPAASKPQININPDHNKLLAHGITPEAFTEAVRTATSQPADASELDALQKASVKTPQGNLIPLREVATFEITKTPRPLIRKIP